MSSIQDVLNSEEGKAAIKKMIDEAVDAEVKGLKEKNKELLGKLKTAEKTAEELEEAKRASEEQAAAKGGDVEKVKKQLQEKHDKELQKLRDQLDAKGGSLNKLLIGNGLTDALNKAGVAPQLVEAARALILTNSKAEITDVDGNPVAMIDGKPLGDFVKEWSQGDTGKNFAAAPLNGGGGSGGGGKAPAGTKKKSEMSHTDKAAYIKEHGQEAYAALP